MTRTRACGTVGILLVLGCATTPASEGLTDADRDAIRQYYVELARVLSPEDNDAWLKGFTADAVFMVQDQPTIRGHDALDAWGKGDRSGFVLSAAFSDIEIHGSGDWAWVTVKQVLTLQGVDEAVPGKALAVFQRQPDGRWLTAAVSGSNDQPVSGN